MGNIKNSTIRIALSLAFVMAFAFIIRPTRILAAGVCGTGTWTPGYLEIHHINIGEGDATLIVSPTGKSLLFDVGESNWNSSARARIVGPYIETVLGCKSLDYVVISHFHVDHIGYVGYGGLWHLVETQGFTVGTTLVRNYDSYLGNSSGTLTNWKAYLEGAGQAKLQPLTAGEGMSQVNLGPGVIFNIVTVDGNGAIRAGDFHADANAPSENDYSLGALLSYGNFDEWIGGDLDGEYQVSEFGYAYHDIELSAAREIGDVDVYKVDHHGSSHSSNPTFINQLDPEVSIVSVGDGNSYGHPTQSVMDRLLATSAVYMTERGDTNTTIGSAVVAGNIVIKTSNGSAYTVNGTSFTATEPGRTDADGDGYFAEADPNDTSADQIPAANGGCSPDYQTCSVTSLTCDVSPGQVLINEVLPAPSNNGTEWIELYNTTTSTVNIGNCYIDDSVNGSAIYQIPASTLILAHGFWTLDRNSYFNNTGDDARFLKEDGTTLLDFYTFGGTAYDVSRYRLPDGGAWAGSPTTSTTKGQSNTIPFYPIVTSIVRTDENPSSTNIVHFTVGFSKPVTGVTIDDFALAVTGLSGASISAVSGSGTTYSVTVSAGFEEGTVRLDVIDNDSILDSTAHPLGGAGTGNGSFTSGETYTIQITKVFDNGIWWIQKGDTPVLRSEMSVYLNGVYHGTTRLLQYGHKREGQNSWPEIAAMYNTGYVRLVPYNLPYGTSFILGPAYWENAGGTPRYFHDLQISRVDINTSAINSTTGKGPLQLTVYARDYSSAYWPNYHLNIIYNITLPDPQSSETQMNVVQTYTVANPFSLSSIYQSGHEGYKLVQFSSMYIDGNFHDSNGSQFPDQSGNMVSSDFAAIQCGTNKFPSPQALSVQYPWVEVSHRDNAGWQGNTPNTLVMIDSPILPGQIVPQGFITCSNDPNNDNVGLWLNDETAPANFNQGYSKAVEYTLIARDNPTNLHVSIGGRLRSTHSVSSSESLRETYNNIDNGPVKITSINNSPLIASQRINLKASPSYSSYTEFMGLPAGKLTDTYIFPWYNNANAGGVSSQLRFGNVGIASTVVTIKIAGVAQVPTYTLAPNESARVTLDNVDAGPVEVKSSGGVPIIASMRINLKKLPTYSSYTEFLGLSASSTVGTKYIFPWYNNATAGGVSSQLRFGNVGNASTVVTIKVGGVAQVPTYTLAPNESARVTLDNVDNGPVEVVSSGGMPIIVSQRINLKTNPTYSSYSEFMGLPGAVLTETRYLFPWYNNANAGGVQSQLRFANVGNASTTVSIKIGGVTQPQTYTLTPNESARVTLDNVDSGPVEVFSSAGVPIIASMRVNLKTNPTYSSYSEFMGLSVGAPLGMPGNELSTTYWFPWYNNATTGGLSSQLRFGVP